MGPRRNKPREAAAVELCRTAREGKEGGGRPGKSGGIGRARPRGSIGRAERRGTRGERNRRIPREGGHARPLRSSFGSCILWPGPPPMVYTYPLTFFSYRRFTDLPPHDIFQSPVGSFPCVRATVNV